MIHDATPPVRKSISFIRYINSHRTSRGIWFSYVDTSLMAKIDVVWNHTSNEKVHFALTLLPDERLHLNTMVSWPTALNFKLSLTPSRFSTLRPQQ